MKYAVQAASLSEAIHVGRVSKKGDAFLDKEEATDMVLAAVAQYVAENFEGGMMATFPKLNLSLTVTVAPLVSVAPINGEEKA